MSSITQHVCKLHLGNQLSSRNLFLGTLPLYSNYLPFGMVAPLDILPCSKNLSSRTLLFGSTLQLVCHNIYLRGI
jgi:hypothetical protein